MGVADTSARRALFWRLVRVQHGLVTRKQLLELGLSAKAIEHRLRAGRLHVVRPGVYAVGRPDWTRHGEWMAAVLYCGPTAVLSHGSAAALWMIARDRRGPVNVSVLRPADPRAAGIAVHRRRAFERTVHQGIPVTTPACTVIDLAAGLGRRGLEAAINEADKRGLVDLAALRRSLDDTPHRPGARPLRQLIDEQTFRFTDSELEREFLPLVKLAGLPAPRTRCRVNGFKVDFYWPEARLVVETDGGTFHRTPAQQTRDRMRDQAHLMAGLVPLRFTHGQIHFRPAYVCAVLPSVYRPAAPG